MPEFYSATKLLSMLDINGNNNVLSFVYEEIH